jgi:hypothetical protein
MSYGPGGVLVICVDHRSMVKRKKNKKKISTILIYGFTATTNDDEFTEYAYV